jgi:ribonuclease E
MSKIMLINVTHAEESRVGIVEDGQLESFEIESLSREHLKGNIYKGIVRRIHPAIEAAFVDIGAERDAFLPLDEICFRNLPAGRNGGSGEKGRRRIKDVLKSGDEVLVQIIKEQFTSKPPTLSTFYSLPGRYLVLLPGSDDAGISRKIEGEERLRVRELIERLRPPPGCGIIVRTAAGFDEDQGELDRDLTYLQRLWDNIKRHAETRRAPALIYREHDLVLRNIRDYFTPDITEIHIDNDEVYERARDFFQSVMPGKEHLLRLYTGEQPIFSHFGVESQIESIYKRRVQLKSGGSIVIDGTEALTAIDVNSGGSMRGASQEETAYKTNVEAAREIARQLRLRDLGGIIVIDFIDMRIQSHINDVERALRDAMRADKARHDIGRISRLGLLEVSRQRLRPAAAASSYTACPMCEGHGSVRTTESAALVALRKIHNRISQGDVAQMKVSLPQDVAMYLLNQKRDDLATLEARYAARIQVAVSDKLMPHQVEIEFRTRETVKAPLPVVRPGEVARAAVVPLAGATARRGGERAASARPRRPAAAPAAETEGAAAEPAGVESPAGAAVENGTPAAAEAAPSAAGQEYSADGADTGAGEAGVEPVAAASVATLAERIEAGRSAARPGGEDPRMGLYLLPDGPLGMAPEPVEDPSADEEETLAEGEAPAEADQPARRRRRRGGRRGGRSRRRPSEEAAAAEPTETSGGGGRSETEGEGAALAAGTRERAVRPAAAAAGTRELAEPEATETAEPTVDS